MEVTAQMYLIVLPLVFLAALIDAIAGGGGLISLPAYLVAGLGPVLASGTNKCSALLGSFMATVKFTRNRRMPFVPALLAAAGALPGAYMGAELLKHISDQWLRAFLLVALPLAAAFLLFGGARAGGGEPAPISRKQLAICPVIGLFVGFYDGFFGPGTGTILILLFTWLIRMDMVSASGAAKLVNLSSNVAAAVSLLIGGKVLLALALPAAACSALGGYLGARLALQNGAKLIRWVMALVMALLMIKLAADYFFGA